MSIIAVCARYVFVRVEQNIYCQIRLKHRGEHYSFFFLCVNVKVFLVVFVLLSQKQGTGYWCPSAAPPVANACTPIDGWFFFFDDVFEKNQKKFHTDLKIWCFSDRSLDDSRDASWVSKFSFFFSFDLKIRKHKKKKNCCDILSLLSPTFNKLKPVDFFFEIFYKIKKMTWNPLT